VSRVGAQGWVVSPQKDIPLVIHCLDSLHHLDGGAVRPTRDHNLANPQNTFRIEPRGSDQGTIAQQRSHALAVNTQRVD
jgi:hypothetical protein